MVLSPEDIVAADEAVRERQVPLLSRSRILNLNGTWHFRLDPDDVGENDGWFRPGTVRDRTIPVPAPWQFVFEELRDYDGEAWYERTFTIPEQYRGRRIVVVFGAVDYSAKV